MSASGRDAGARDTGGLLHPMSPTRGFYFSGVDMSLWRSKWIFECFTQHQILAAASSWVLCYKSFGFNQRCPGRYNICWAHIWSYTLSIRTGLVSYRSEWEEGHPPWFTSKNQWLWFGPWVWGGSLNLAEVVVCTLIAGSRQSGDWNKVSGMLAPNYMERILLIC